MRIAQITPYFLPHNGGMEMYVYNLSKGLINEGHTVEVITSNIPERAEPSRLWMVSASEG